MRTIHRTIAVALIFSKDGKILQLLRSETQGAVYGGHWGIVGGGTEPGEQLHDALVREVREETGIDIGAYPAEHIDTAEDEGEKTLKDTGEIVLCKMIFHTYKVVLSDTRADDLLVTLNEEHTDYRWSDPSELSSFKLTPPSVTLFTKLGYLVDAIK
jgi:nucleoside triphosphatase